MIANARPVVYPPRQCADTYGRPKRLFPRRRDARRALRLNGAKDQHEYWCERCAAYHCGHKK